MPVYLVVMDWAKDICLVLKDCLESISSPSLSFLSLDRVKLFIKPFLGAERLLWGMKRSERTDFAEIFIS